MYLVIDVRCLVNGKSRSLLNAHFSILYKCSKNIVLRTEKNIFYLKFCSYIWTSYYVVHMPISYRELDCEM